MQRKTKVIKPEPHFWLPVKKKKKEGMCMMLRDTILCQRSLRPWEGSGGCDGKGGGQGGIGWKEEHKVS